MMLEIITGLIVIASSLIYIWIRKKFSFFDEHGFAYEKPEFPYGNLKDVGKSTHHIYKIIELYEKFKSKASAFGIFFFVNPAIVITDLDVAKDILIRNFDKFHNRGIYYNLKDDPLSGHLFAIEDLAWRNMRAKLTPTFTSGKMKMVFSTMLDIAERMTSHLKTEHVNSDIIEMKEVLAKFTTDVIGNIAFGLEMNSINDSGSMYRKMGRKIFKTDSNMQIKILFLTAFQSLGRKLRMRFFDNNVSDFFLRTIRETVDYRVKNKIQRKDVIDLLIKMWDHGKPQEEKITFNELAAQCFVYFVAGFETSSATACFALYALALNQDVQEKLRIEIKKTLTKYNGEITYDAMQEMEYLQMVIDETLRLYGPVSMLVRKPSEDYEISHSNLVIPKGTLTLIPSTAIHFDSDIYLEPDKFNPERFTEENKKNRHSIAHLAFGQGPRNCIGSRFGLMQVKVALIKLLMNFKFSASPRTSIPMKFNSRSLTLVPHDDMWLKVEFV